MKLVLSFSKYRTLLLFFLCMHLIHLPGGSVHAQDYLKKENSVWVFGHRTGIDFSSGIPVAITSAMKTLEAAASVSDPTGRLLFYTDGTTVWDQDNNVMPNGVVLTGIRRTEPVTSSSSYGTAIIPIPGNPFQYYVFSVTKVEMSYEDPALYGMLFYSIVDMRLNGGKGDVITKANLLDTNIQEKIAGVVGGGCYNWLIAHDQDSALFKSWRITPRGLEHQPVRSYTGPIPDPDWSDYYGIILPSPDRTKLAITRNARDAQLYDFDPISGTVGNVLLQNLGGGFSAAFSPNSQVLYITGLQIDLSVSPPGVFGTYANYDMKLAADEKIYFFLNLPHSGFGVIHAPNMIGPNALIQVAPPVLPLPDQSPTKLFSNTVPIIHTDTLTSYRKICATDSTLLMPTDTSGLHYLWTDTVEGYARIAHHSGIYILQYFLESACAYVFDTFDFQRYTVPDLGPDTILCTGASITLDPKISDASLRWQNGQTTPTLLVINAGTYSVEADMNGCRSSDTVVIEFVDLAQDLGNDHKVCKGAPIDILLQAQGPSNATFLWQDGSTLATFQPSDSGTYWVEVRVAECSGTDTVHIEMEICDCPVFVPNAFTPNGDGKNDYFKPSMSVDCPVSEYRMNIYNRWGTLVYTTTVASEGWNGLYNGLPAEPGTYMYTVETKVGHRAIAKKFKGDLTLVR